MKNRIFILHLIGIFLFCFFYDAVFSRLPFQAAVVLILLAAVMSNWQFSLFWSIILGIFLDSSFTAPPGVFLISLVLICLAANFFLWHFLPHGSFYSLLVILPAGTLIFELSLHFFAYLLELLKLNNLGLALNFSYLIKILMTNTLAGLSIFLIAHFTSRFWRRRFF